MWTVTLAIIGFFLVFIATAEYDRRVTTKILNSASRKVVPEEKTTLTITDLDYESYPDFDSEYVPYCTEKKDSYLNILRNYARWYRANANKNERNRETNEWLQPALSELENQCDAMHFAVTSITQIAETMKEKGLTTIAAGTYKHTQEVIDTFAKNRAESVDLLLQIDNALDKKLLKKQRAKLQCLIKDNEELINGLDTFISTISHIIAKLCKDNHPDHLTDFTSLHELLEIPNALNKALAIVEEQLKAEEEAKAKKEAEAKNQVMRVKTVVMPNVPTINFQTDKRTPTEFFTNLGLGSSDSAAQPEISSIIDRAPGNTANGN